MKKNLLFSIPSLTLLALIFCATKTSDLSAMHVSFSCCNTVNQIEEEMNPIATGLLSQLQEKHPNKQQVTFQIKILLQQHRDNSFKFNKFDITKSLPLVIEKLVFNEKWKSILFLLTHNEQLIANTCIDTLSIILKNHATTNSNELTEILFFLAQNKKNNKISTNTYTHILSKALKYAAKDHVLNTEQNNKRAFKFLTKPKECIVLKNLYPQIKSSIDMTTEPGQTLFYNILSEALFKASSNKLVFDELFDYIFKQEGKNTVLRTLISKLFSEIYKKDNSYKEEYELFVNKSYQYWNNPKSL
ncbi:MAG: hypothetical protein ABH827_01445 [bacterium]